jgi:hypothetical protein
MNPIISGSGRGAVLLIFLLALALFSASAFAASDYKKHKRYLYVQPGQTVSSIVKVLYPDRKDQWPEIIQQIVKKNPHAFRNGIAAEIRVGERLLLPDFTVNKKSIAKVSVYKGPEAVGLVLESRGKTFVISRLKKRRDLQVGSEVFIGDRVFTGVDGFVRMGMIDDAKIDLRCNSEMLIEDYKLLKSGNRSVIYLLKGSLRKITGSIGKMANDLYEMKTPIATVGVRGTDYAIRVLQSHGCDGSVDVNNDGMFVKVKSGQIDLKNNLGVFGLQAGEAALVEAKNVEPRAIDADDSIFGEEKSSWLWWLLGIIAIVAVA